MNDADLLELSQFQFPSITIDELTTQPYLAYVQDYKYKYGEYKFYRGFKNPDIYERAKIYRAIDLCCDDNMTMDNFIIFNSSEGLIIKCKHIPIDSEFDLYLSQDNSYIYIPINCNKLDQYNYSYYRRMLNTFKTNERINCKVIRMNEINNTLLFLSSKNPLPVDLNIKWKEFTQSIGVIRKFIIPSDKLCKSMQMFPWEYRVSFLIIDDMIELTVRSCSLDDFETRLKTIESSDSITLKYIDLDFIIKDEYEAFGLLRILNRNDVIPLMNTSRIYFTDDLDLNLIEQYEYNGILPEGSEIYTQEDYSEMSKYRLASLIKVPTGNLYSLLDIYRNPKKEDPYTREEYSQDFILQIEDIMNNLKGIFTIGFPPDRFEPELVIIESEPDMIIQTISFYIKIRNILSVFWIIPDLRNTEYNKITLDAISILVKKWSDGSLFKNSNIYSDINLLFSPIALHVFEQTINNLNIETYPRDLLSQAQTLSEQNFILNKI